MRAPTKKVTRIFVARIPDSVNEAAFRRYFIFLCSITYFVFFFNFQSIFLPSSSGFCCELDL